MVLAMPEVVFEMIAFGFKDIVVFIFRFPTCSACCCDLGNIVRGDGMVSNEGIAISDSTICGFGDHDFTPVHV